MTDGNAGSEGSQDLRSTSDSGESDLTYNDEAIADQTEQGSASADGDRDSDSGGTMLFHRPIRWIRQSNTRS